MTNAATQLQLLWLASPALPVGAFSYSEGLESAIDAGDVVDESSAGDWLLDQLWLVMARAELPTVAHAMAAWQVDDLQRVRALNDWVLQTRESAEQRLQSVQMGASMLAWLRNGEHASDRRLERQGSLASAWPVDPSWPVVTGLAYTLAGASVHDALLTNAFSWAENMVQAAIKATPLGQAAAQRVLGRLARDVPAVVAHAVAVEPGERQAFAPRLAILGALHETQYTRIFRS